jgi:hypothetical protein
MVRAADPNGMRLAWLALATGILPFVVVQACYLLSAQAGHVPACVPYLAGCTSISSAGRHGAAYFLFKAGMIPAAALMAAYWLLCRKWLLSLGAADTAATRLMVGLGSISAAFLVLYTVYLGSPGDFYNLMRRYGVNVHLSFGVLAQIVLTRELMRLSHPGLTPRIMRSKFVLVGLLLGLGLLSIPINNFVADKGRAMNVIEWNFAAVMAGYYVLSAWAWRVTGFRATFSTARSDSPMRD